MSRIVDVQGPDEILKQYHPIREIIRRISGVDEVKGKPRLSYPIDAVDVSMVVEEVLRWLQISSVKMNVRNELF